MIKKLILITIFLLSTHTVSFACDCPQRPTVLKSFHGAGTVMLVRLESAAEWPPEHKATIHRGINFVVEKVYKGDMKPGDGGMLAHGRRIAEGRYSFHGCEKLFHRKDVGKKLLLYGGDAKPGLRDWVVFECGRTAFLPEAAADIKWLEGPPLFRELSRLSGRVVLDTLDPATREYSLKGVDGVKVEIEGDLTEGKKRKRVKLRTDADGVYEAYGLAPGIYKVEITRPKKSAVNHSRIYGDLDPRVGHTEEELAEVRRTQSLMDGLSATLKNDPRLNLEGIRFIQVTRSGHSVVDFYLKEKK